MKTLKKIMAFAVCLVMVLAMTVTAFADDATSGTTKYTIKAPDTKHVYQIYQIFIGDFSSTSGKLSNIKWGQNGINNSGDDVDSSILTALEEKKDRTESEKLTKILEYVDLESTAIATICGSTDDANTYPKTYSAVGGYYLIRDLDSAVPEGEAATPYLVKVVNDLDFTPKESYAPSFEKKLKDTNDSTEATSGWQDSADYDIGDTIPFQLKATLPNNYEDYEHYYLAFHDVEETGLTFKNITKVYVKNGDVETELTKNTDYVLHKKGDAAAIDTDCTFEIEIIDLTKVTTAKNGSQVIVEYDSQLNNSATLGKQGNVNKAKLNYSNNPSSTQEGKPDNPGSTPWDNVIVFTYQVVVDKYADSVAEAKKLSGAEFTLTKNLKDGTTKTIDVVKSQDGTSFTFKGLDDGTYTLTETVTPDGYNTVKPMTFTVTAEHTIEWSGENRNQVLTSLTGTADTGSTIELTADADKAKLSTNVVNMSGSTLPSTGGIGTRIFYIIGGLLMAAAAVVLITKVRFNKNK